ncbi:Hypothetical predicted protein [Olea europaea subsp. europaea]|uniref:Uncharacterized protein n=1 Tax=Olea europaea subsp. europaea TaxID=158383 RepID=A0A8S0TIK9_OLEEU|nr:Hypothetical predicted protein [Olea europaea subsp. europaea]
MKSLHEGQWEPFGHGIKALIDFFFKYYLVSASVEKYFGFGLSEYSSEFLSANFEKYRAVSSRRWFLGYRSFLWLIFRYIFGVMSVDSVPSWYGITCRKPLLLGIIWNLMVFSWKSAFGIGRQILFAFADRSIFADGFI